MVSKTYIDRDHGGVFFYSDGRTDEIDRKTLASSETKLRSDSDKSGSECEVLGIPWLIYFTYIFLKNNTG